MKVYYADPFLVLMPVLLTNRNNLLKSFLFFANVLRLSICIGELAIESLDLKMLRNVEEEGYEFSKFVDFFEVFVLEIYVLFDS